MFECDPRTKEYLQKVKRMKGKQGEDFMCHQSNVQFLIFFVLSTSFSINNQQCHVVLHCEPDVVTFTMLLFWGCTQSVSFSNVLLNFKEFLNCDCFFCTLILITVAF